MAAIGGISESEEVSSASEEDFMTADREYFEQHSEQSYYVRERFRGE